MINETCFVSRLQNMPPTTGKSQFMKMENFMEFIRAGLISIFSIYENEKLRGIRASHPISGKKYNLAFRSASYVLFYKVYIKVIDSHYL